MATRFPENIHLISGYSEDKQITSFESAMAYNSETKFDGPRLFSNTLLWSPRVSDCNTKWARLILV